jgi:hypothetical protein
VYWSMYGHVLQRSNVQLVRVARTVCACAPSVHDGIDAHALAAIVFAVITRRVLKYRYRTWEQVTLSITRVAQLLACAATA